MDEINEVNDALNFNGKMVENFVNAENCKKTSLKNLVTHLIAVGKNLQNFHFTKGLASN